MKKLFTMFLIFVMLFAFSAAAMAEGEESTPITLNWISARNAFSQAGITGSFYEIKDFGMDIWVPDILTPQDEIPEDCYYVFTDENESVSVKVHYVGFEEEVTLQSLEKLITDLGSESDGIFWINNYDALIYDTKAIDSTAVIIPFDSGNTLEFVFEPMSNPDFYSLASLIMSTIQPHQLSVVDVAMMIDADLNSVWGPEKSVRYTDDENGTTLTVFLWEEGITSETIGNVNNWEAVREDKVRRYNNYVDILNELGMGDTVLLTLMYISPEEDLSFLTITGGEITYDELG